MHGGALHKEVLVHYDASKKSTQTLSGIILDVVY